MQSQMDIAMQRHSCNNAQIECLSFRLCYILKSKCKYIYISVGEAVLILSTNTMDQ